MSNDGSLPNAPVNGSPSILCGYASADPNVSNVGSAMVGIGAHGRGITIPLPPDVPFSPDVSGGREHSQDAISACAVAVSSVTSGVLVCSGDETDGAEQLNSLASTEAEGNESEVSVEYLPAAKPGLPVSVEYLPAAKPGLPVSCSAVPHQGNPGSQSPSQPYYHGDVNVSRHEATSARADVRMRPDKFNPPLDVQETPEPTSVSVISVSSPEASGDLPWSSPVNTRKEVEPRPKRQAAQTASWLLDATLTPGHDTIVHSWASRTSLMTTTKKTSTIRDGVGRGPGRGRGKSRQRMPRTTHHSQVQQREVVHRSNKPSIARSIGNSSAVSISPARTARMNSGLDNAECTNWLADTDKQLVNIERVARTPTLSASHLQEMDQAFKTLWGEIELQRQEHIREKQRFLSRYRAMQNEAHWPKADIEKGRQLSQRMRLLSSLVSRCKELVPVFSSTSLPASANALGTMEDEGDTAEEGSQPRAAFPVYDSTAKGPAPSIHAGQRRRKVKLLEKRQGLPSAFHCPPSAGTQKPVPLRQRAVVLTPQAMVAISCPPVGQSSTLASFTSMISRCSTSTTTDSTPKAVSPSIGSVSSHTSRASMITTHTSITQPSHRDLKSPRTSPPMVSRQVTSCDSDISHTHHDQVVSVTPGLVSDFLGTESEKIKTIVTSAHAGNDHTALSRSGRGAASGWDNRNAPSTLADQLSTRNVIANALSAALTSVSAANLMGVSSPGITVLSGGTSNSTSCCVPSQSIPSSQVSTSECWTATAAPVNVHFGDTSSDVQPMSAQISSMLCSSPAPQDIVAVDLVPTVGRRSSSDNASSHIDIANLAQDSHDKAPVTAACKVISSTKSIQSGSKKAGKVLLSESSLPSIPTLINAGVIKSGRDALAITIPMAEGESSTNTSRTFKSSLLADGSVECAGGERFNTIRFWANVCLSSVLPSAASKQVKLSRIYGMVTVDGKSVLEHVASYTIQDQAMPVADRSSVPVTASTANRASPERGDGNRTGQVAVNGNSQFPASCDNSQQALQQRQAMLQAGARPAGPTFGEDIAWPPKSLAGFLRLMPQQSHGWPSMNCDWTNKAFLQQCFAHLSDPNF